MPRKYKAKTTKVHHITRFVGFNGNPMQTGYFVHIVAETSFDCPQLSKTSSLT